MIGPKTGPISPEVARFRFLLMLACFFGWFVWRKWQQYQAAKLRFEHFTDMEEAKKCIELFRFMEEKHGRKLPSLLEKAQRLVDKWELPEEGPPRKKENKHASK